MFSKTKPTIHLLHIVLFVSVLILLGSYVFLVNSMTGDTFQIKTLGDRIMELSEDNEALGLEASRVQSLAALQEKSEGLGLKEVSRVNYIKASSREPLVLVD